MRTLGLVLASTLFAAPALASPGEAPIVGGTNATVGQFPTTVGIEVGGGLCTGTLLTKDWVLTAAHCVDPAVLGGSQAQITSSVRVHFDTVSLFARPGTVVRASETIKHPQFNVNALGRHDVGLIHLATPVTDRVPVPINLVPGKAPIGIAVTMVGFGVTSTAQQGSAGIERVVAQTSVSCAFGNESDASLLCFDQTGGKGKCEGDSGGPSFAMIDGKLTQVGVTSFGDQSCREFGADSRTDAEVAFLEQRVPELACGVDGTCHVGCGAGPLPIDPDCACSDAAPCGAGNTCFHEQCIADPFSTAGLGSTCVGGADCQSGACASADDQSLCVMSCTPGADDPCPGGFTCRDFSSGGGVCWPGDDSGGCCSTGGGGAPTALVGLAAVALVLGRRRRR